MPPAQNASMGPTIEASAGGPEPAWRQRAIERSTQPARQRAAKRVQRFLNSAREIIAEKGSIEFTVQEVVDRSKQSLRSFYQYFDGKHELLLACSRRRWTSPSDAHARCPRRATPSTGCTPPWCRSTSSAARAGAVQPLFSDFAQRLLLDHPEDVATAYAPVLEYIASIVDEAADAGCCVPAARTGWPRSSSRPRP